VTLVTVRVRPGSSRNEIAGEQDGVLVVRVNAPPVGGQANKAVRKLLAKHYGVAPSRVEIVRGHAAREKVVRLDLEP
jgi:uncharacterized protein (TIGR00251 family)